MRKKVRLAVDVGGTHMKIGVVSDGLILAQDSLLVEDRLRFLVHTKQLKSRFEGLLSSLGLELSDCERLCMAVPSLVSSDSSRVTRTFKKFEDLVGLDLQEWSLKNFGVVCDLENDARAALIGEWHYGAGRGVENLFMLTLGTGCGTAVVLGGEVIRGYSGMAGNMGGHSITHRGGEKCWCGSRGCLEAQVASWALDGIAKRNPRLSESALSSLEKVDYRAVFEWAAAGDTLAVELRDRALDAWAAVLINAVHFFDPEKIIIGGGLMASSTAILPALQEVLDQQSIQVAGPVKVVAAELGDGAALLGF